MRRMLATLPALALLAACTTTTDLDASIQKSLPQICDGADVLHAAFVAVSVSGAVSAKVIDREAQAWAVLAPLCADPANANTTTVLITAANAYIVIVQAIKEAKKTNG